LVLDVQRVAGDGLVHAGHIPFQVTPLARVPEISARAEQTLNELLHEPERFASEAGEMFNCPSGQQGGNLGRVGRGDTVPEFERALFRLRPTPRLKKGSEQCVSGERAAEGHGNFLSRLW
jgi:hypothetical protein